MGKPRFVGAVVSMLTHDQGMKNCFVGTTTAFHTVELAGYGHFAALVINQPDSPCGAVSFLDREEVEAHITLLRNSIEDAERMDRGLSPIHATPSLRRN